MNKPVPHILSGKASVLLDSLRLGAALTVVGCHALEMWFPALSAASSIPAIFSHTAVVIFFVLSGYVIAHTTTSNNRGPRHYAQARLSRLYSALVPALLFTAFAEFVAVRLAPELAGTLTRGTSWPRYFIVGGFLNEIWFFSAAPPINVPLWSLSFEFWYYAIFGFWFYRRAGWTGLLLPIAACLVAGPKILLMLPIWLAGVAAYRLPRLHLSTSWAWALVAAALIAALIIATCLPPVPFEIGQHPLFFAGQFLSDWLVGSFVAFALWILPTQMQPSLPAQWISKFRQVADLTFPIYVLHNPLLILWRVVFHPHSNSVAQMTLALGSVLLMAGVLGLLLERQRPAWVRFFKWLLRPRGVQHDKVTA